MTDMPRKLDSAAFVFATTVSPTEIMASLHIFNPDTDYALAADSAYYTAPARIIALRNENVLLPALYADTGDTILLMDEPADSVENLKYNHLATAKSITILTPGEIAGNPDSISSLQPLPWGWNRQIRNWLIEISDGKISGIPSEADLSKLRELSHRRTTIAFLKEMEDMLDPDIRIPEEVNSTARGVSSFRSERRLYFKAPWSSSGRGILLTDDLEEKHVEPWIRGIIRKQGSVMMERAYIRRLDFATEWQCRDGEASFLGYSVFNVSRRGKYQSNTTGTQDSLLDLIKSATPKWNPAITEKQKSVLEKLIAPFYSGPLGIDMLVTGSGAVHPCVEINLRHTMGMANLKRSI